MRYAHAPESSDFRDGPVRGRRQYDSEGRFGGHSHGAHDGHWTGGRGRGRAQRGDVRAAVLMLLSEQPMHGYQLIRAIIERTAGAWRLSPDAVYPTITQLEDEGLVSVVAEAGRKLVTLADAGREFLTANQAALGDPFTTVQTGPNSDLRGAIELLHAAARAADQSGTTEQITAAREILDRARRQLYRMLADNVSTSPTAPTEAAGQTGEPS
jgi:DNA-binding PadR family transcriptional regulator